MRCPFCAPCCSACSRRGGSALTDEAAVAQGSPADPAAAPGARAPGAARAASHVGGGAARLRGRGRRRRGRGRVGVQPGSWRSPATGRSRALAGGAGTTARRGEGRLGARLQSDLRERRTSRCRRRPPLEPRVPGGTLLRPRGGRPGRPRPDRPRAGGAVLTARRRAGGGGGRPRCPHSGHGERATSSRHQRHVHGPAADELAPERLDVERVRDASTSLPVPHHFGPLGVGSTRAPGGSERRVDGGIHAVRRRGRRPRAGSAARSAAAGRRPVAAEAVHGGLGIGGDAERAAGRERREVLAEARRRTSSPPTLPSQVKTCSSASSSGSSEASTPVDGSVRRDRGGERREHRRGERRQRRPVDRQPCVSSADRTIARRPTAASPDPLRPIATRCPRLQPGGHRLDQPAICSCPGGSTNASMRPSPSSRRSGLSPRTSRTGGADGGGFI